MPLHLVQDASLSSRALMDNRTMVPLLCIIKALIFLKSYKIKECQDFSEITQGFMVSQMTYLRFIQGSIKKTDEAIVERKVLTGEFRKWVFEYSLFHFVYVSKFYIEHFKAMFSQELRLILVFTGKGNVNCRKPFKIKKNFFSLHNLSSFYNLYIKTQVRAQ